MRLWIGKSILKRKFGSRLPAETREVLRRAVKPPLLLAIKGAALPARTQLLKAYATSRQGSRRIVLLFVIEQDDLFLLFYRPKGDKIGDNVSIKNSAIKSALAKYLAFLREDIASDALEEISLVSPPSP